MTGFTKYLFNVLALRLEVFVLTLIDVFIVSVGLDDHVNIICSFDCVEIVSAVL